MSIGEILLAAATLPLLLYLPGWALQARVGAPADRLERQYERVVVSALWSGWLALLLASLGIFSLWLHLGLTIVAAALVAFVGRRAARTDEPDAPAGPRWEPIGHAVVLAVALLLVARPFEVVLGVRDAGVYASTGFAIARTGALVQQDPLLAQLARDTLSADPAVAEPAKQAISNFTLGQPRDRYIATRLRAAGFFVYQGELETGRVIPQGLHLLPAWIGLLAAAGGPYLGLFAPGLLGVLGVWSVGMLGRRLAGPWVGLLAMALLALNGTQVWFSRYSTAETVAQFLIWAGLYFFAKMQGERGRAAMIAGALAGVAIGQVALARLDFFLLVPVLLYLIYCFASRRWSRAETALTVGLGLLLLHAALHIVLIARAYFFDTGFDRLYQDYALVALGSLPFLTPEMREVFLTDPRSVLVRPIRLPGRIELGPWVRIAAELALAAIGVGAVLLLRSRAGLLRRIEGRLVAWRTPLLRAVFAALLLVSGYAYFVRPEIVDADMLFNTRGGWSDPLTRDPNLVAIDVREGHMTPDEARNQAGVVLTNEPIWRTAPDPAATEALRARLSEERGPWAGPFNNQTLNWLRLQGYVGAPVRLPLRYWTNEYGEMTWQQLQTLDMATLSSPPATVNDKYLIPLANLVRMGWYLSPLGVVLGCIGYALWWRRGLNRASWLFLTVAFVGTAFYVRQTYGTSDQHYIYILRRFVPIAYPAFALGTAYALVLLAGAGAEHGGRRGTSLLRFARPALAGSAAALLLLFLGWTNRPIFGHVEYQGAVAQLRELAGRFEPGRDVLLMRGGAPVFAESRDIPDLIATPLRFDYGLDAFAVKSSTPGKYAVELAAQAQHWREQGREVYLLLSASGASLALPGFALEPIGTFELNLPEFEQLTDQKPRNVSRLTLPFAIYRAVPSAPGSVAAAPQPATPETFVAQVGGLYRPERRADGTNFSWTNGDATLRLPWRGDGPAELSLELSPGERPAHLGPARVCVSALPETRLWPEEAGLPTDLGCLDLQVGQGRYAIRLDPGALPPAPGGTLLLRLDSEAWVPAAEDPRQGDQRGVGVQLGEVSLVPVR